jgi:hypothetical protein
VSAEVAELTRRIERLTSADRLRLAADMLDRGRTDLAETIVSRVATELGTFRLRAHPKERRRG